MFTLLFATSASRDVHQHEGDGQVTVIPFWDHLGYCVQHERFGHHIGLPEIAGKDFT